MSATAPPAPSAGLGGYSTRRLRLVFLGPPGWLESCCPPASESAERWLRLPILESTDVEDALGQARAFAPRVTVVFDPGCLPAEALAALPGTTLGILVGGLDDPELPLAAGRLDRVLSFRSELTGRELGAGTMWRAIPPPVADGLFAEVRPLHDRPAAMTIGRSTAFREHMLLPAKHHHDLLQVLHGVGAELMAELLGDCDVGVYVPPGPDSGFGPQVGIHLAAGQLLFAHKLGPEHGLERGIDYLSFESPEELVWALERLARFPEMHQRVRIRGRMKAESYRASRLFQRIAHDLLADVAAFGSSGRRA